MLGSAHRQQRAPRIRNPTWERQRNTSRTRIKSMFTTEKARAKMKRAYPQPSMCRAEGSSQPVDLLQMREGGACAGRVGEQIERDLLVLSDRCERGVLVRSSGQIARDDKLEHKQARDRCDDDSM